MSTPSGVLLPDTSIHNGLCELSNHLIVVGKTGINHIFLIFYLLEISIFSKYYFFTHELLPFNYCM